jgi:RNA polymerase sigma-70 factor (sigma-E family)
VNRASSLLVGGPHDTDRRIPLAIIGDGTTADRRESAKPPDNSWVTAPGGWQQIAMPNSLDGVEGDFGQFLAARSAALFGTALLLTGDAHAADDLVQATLEKACRKWGRAVRADSPEAYVRRIMVNLAKDSWRRDRGRRELPLTEELVGGADPFRRTDQRDELIRALLRLPIRMRTILVLRYFDDLEDPSIAGLLGISQATVRSQCARGVTRLRAEVEADRTVLSQERLGGTEL